MKSIKVTKFLYFGTVLSLLLAIGILLFVVYYINQNQPPRQNISASLPSSQPGEKSLQDELDKQITPAPIQNIQDLKNSLASLNNTGTDSINNALQDLQKTSSQFTK